jgi:hypothetical protein
MATFHSRTHATRSVTLLACEDEEIVIKSIPQTGEIKIEVASWKEPKTYVLHLTPDEIKRIVQLSE